MTMKRMRGRGGHRPGGGGPAPIRQHGGSIPLNRNHVFDSSGPDLRIRGTAQQLSEKYLQLGRDATAGGDRVLGEGYFQHAEHYFRIMMAVQAVQQSQAPHPQGQYPQGQYPQHQHVSRQAEEPGPRGGRGPQDHQQDRQEDDQPRDDRSRDDRSRDDQPRDHEDESPREDAGPEASAARTRSLRPPVKRAPANVGTAPEA